MEDWYTILGVKSTASAAEIKRAFRTRAKTLHPDIPANVQEKQDNEDKMRDLLRAYQVLSDKILKQEYDIAWAASKGYNDGSVNSNQSFDYRLWLLSRSDLESKSRLIFFDLFHNREEDAILEYLELRSSANNFRLSKYFEKEDFMDCGFILAEELSFKGHFYEALLLLVEVLQLEKDRPYFKLFYPEALAFTFDLVKNNILGILPDELALDCFETALELNFGKKNDAIILRNMSSCYLNIGDKKTAQVCLNEALRLDPSLSGVKLLRRLLEV